VCIIVVAVMAVASEYLGGHVMHSRQPLHGIARGRFCSASCLGTLYRCACRRQPVLAARLQLQINRGP